MSQIGDRLRTLRNDRGLTQEQLARKAGVTLNTVVRAELGRVTPSRATLIKLARALDVRLEIGRTALIDGDENDDDDSTTAATTA